MADRAVLVQNLAEAEAALHQLMTGKQVASASLDGRSVSYTAADRTALQAYILTLKVELGHARRGHWTGSFR